MISNMGKANKLNAKNEVYFCLQFQDQRFKMIIIGEKDGRGVVVSTFISYQH